ncbi:MAG: energy-coupling factor ABC transporter ATP-binding protein, partial [Firmicutes bacterium]|nr:energy-coupling factor ABC transporter ATP-binding protein [Bacillota bacterium]
MSVLEVKNLSLAFGERTLFRGLDFCVGKGEILGISGKNGAGKSTLIKHIAALSQENLKAEGEVLLNGENTQTLSIARRFGIMSVIFQEPETQLFAPYVTDELAFAPENLCVPRAEIKRRIDFIAALCGITHLLSSRTDKMSGGEKQLVAIAAALTSYPKLILADEITARL